jgi:hypothetical protein
VWGIPWRGNVEFSGLAYCTGGKSIYWGGWCPRLTAGDLQGWPSPVVQYLNTHYTDVESETGVVPGTDFIFGELFNVLSGEVGTAIGIIPNIETMIVAEVNLSRAALCRSVDPANDILRKKGDEQAPLHPTSIRDLLSAAGMSRSEVDHIVTLREAELL